MVWSEARIEYLTERAQREYDRDPVAWETRSQRNMSIFWIIYVTGVGALGTVLLLHSPPRLSEIAAYLGSFRFLRLSLPIFLVVLAAFLYWVKIKQPIFFGSTEIAFAIASSVSAAQELATAGLTAWAVCVAATYVFTKGIENVHKGLVALGERARQAATERYAAKATEAWVGNVRGTIA